MKKLILIISIISLIIPVIVYANAAQPIQNPEDQTIIFNENSGIRLTEETINFKVEENLYKAKVEVEYNLKNLTDKEQNIDIMFITSSVKSADFKVKVNNKEVNDIKKEEDIEPPSNWEVSLKEPIIEPISKKPLDKSPNSYFRNTEDISGATFPVTIKPNETIKLNISYYSDSGFYNYNEIINTVFSQLYYLTPAKFWEEDAKVNLKVEFPKDSNIEFYSNILIEKVNNYTYKGTLNKIPDKEWLFSFTEKKGLIFNTNYRFRHNVLIGLILLLLFIVTRIVKSKVNKKYIPYLLYLLMIPFILNIKLTYGAYFIPLLIIYSIINSPIFYVIFIVIIVFMIKKGFSKNRL
ncbi:hypothetical protein [Caldisalinibacter kiritimatiensis]|uniref:Uncharacterized protein n=1 Tax=Caldisalinibacter kiritimatiensis TaxID=1304284 RepID=R1ATP9_9FIRM|nr:hypothetical protein [Caldisalinibacter kiritimatiensis]EOD00007.1 hypothetical protein L21TH_1950 [Caldisalinibacter kiritimatiensis]